MSAFGSAEGRGTLPAIFRGLLGEPIAVERLGGFLSWRTLNFMPILLGGWSIATLSGSLAGEARRGSLDLLLATPRSRIAVALGKVGGHVVAVGVAALLLPGEDLSSPPPQPARTTRTVARTPRRR